MRQACAHTLAICSAPTQDKFMQQVGEQARQDKRMLELQRQLESMSAERNACEYI